MVDILPDRAQAIATKHNVPKALANYRVMLKDPSIGAVSVCLPNDLHAPVTIACLRAGKHVLCEKPIALNVGQAESMQAEARRARRMLAIGVVNVHMDVAGTVVPLPNTTAAITKAVSEDAGAIGYGGIAWDKGVKAVAVKKDAKTPGVAPTPVCSMTARINGVEMSRGNFNDIYWSFGDMIARASQSVTLNPGDVIGSGTVGTGCLYELTKNQGPWLNHGDVVELEIERIGVLRNTVG